MSSVAARNAITTAVKNATTLTVFDLSDYVSIDDALATIDSEAVLVQYVAADEVLQSIGGEGNQCWEETGSVVIHIMVPTGFDSGPIVADGDTIRGAIRGRRFTDSVVVESMTPFVDFGVGEGTNGAWHGWASNLFYTRRLHGEP